jgi:TnpA family transposase
VRPPIDPCNTAGSKFYSHLSDQYGYFSILPISATESEAPYVMDGLFGDVTVTVGQRLVA